MTVGQSPTVAEMSTGRCLDINFVAFENSKISLLHVPVQDEIEDLQGENTSVDKTSGIERKEIKITILWFSHSHSLIPLCDQFCSVHVE